MTDIDHFFQDASNEAMALGLSRAFRMEFAQIVEYLAEEQTGPLPQEVFEHLERMSLLIESDMQTDSSDKIESLLIAQCEACIRYWDEGTRHSQVTVNLRNLLVKKA